MKYFDACGNPTILGVLVSVVAAINIFGFMFGALENLPMPPQKENGCKYESIASFTPGRVIGCELFRPRF